MAGTVKLPGIGAVKTQSVWIGGAVVVVIVGYEYHRRKQGGGSAGIDPATGYPTGSPQDLAALQGGNQANIDPSTGFPYGSLADQQALGGLGLSGIGAGTTGQTGATGQTGQTGATGGQGYGAPANLHETNVTGTTATLAWDPVSAAHGYVVKTPIGQTHTATGTTYHAGGMTPGHHYTWSVRVNAPGAAESSASFTTPGGAPPTHDYTATGTLTLAQIAARNHDTLAELDRLNPSLAKYNNRKVPRGTKVILPGK